MKILMFVNSYMDLYHSVVNEFRSQGHEVSVIGDFFEYFDPKDVKRRGRLNDARIEKWNQSVTAYWMKFENIIAKQHDIFISLSAGGINSTAFELLDKYSPHCIKIQYCWDSFNIYDFRMIEGYFDRLFTFDIVDAQNPGWKLLPSYYKVNSKEADMVDDVYDLFLIGSNHDKRYSFVRKVLKGLKSENLNNYIKIYVPPIPHLGLNMSIDLIKTLMNFNHIHEMLFKYGYKDNKLLTRNLIGIEEYTEIMNRSKCILDDNTPGQAGLSPRFVRAMALNKKVITTNEWADRYSFVNKENVMVVDKNKPVIDADFIQKKARPSESSNIDSLELSNWVKILIGEIECPSFELNEELK